jgi:hypothetical protein
VRAGGIAALDQDGPVDAERLRPIELEHGSGAATVTVDAPPDY